MNEKAQELMELLGVDGERQVPESAVKQLRNSAGLSQTELAKKAGLSHSLIVALENGQRALSLKSARELAPVLDADEDDLMVAEEISSLQRAALRGELNPRSLFETILELAYDDDKVADELSDALVSVLRTALDSYGGMADGEGAAVATKSEKPNRDSYGRRVDKPFAPKGDDDEEPPRRDPQGRRINKPNDPRRRR